MEVPQDPATAEALQRREDARIAERTASAAYGDAFIKGSASEVATTRAAMEEARRVEDEAKATLRDAAAAALSALDGAELTTYRAYQQALHASGNDAESEDVVAAKAGWDAACAASDTQKPILRAF